MTAALTNCVAMLTGAVGGPGAVGRGWLHLAAVGCAALSLVGALIRWAAARRPEAREVRRSRLVDVCRIMSVSLGAVASLLVAVVLIARAGHAVLETLCGVPLETRDWAALMPYGFLTLGLLIASALVLLRGTRDAKWTAPVVWLCAFAASWAALSIPSLQYADTGVPRRGPSLLALAVALAIVLSGAVLARGAWLWRRRDALVRRDPSALCDPPPEWPGLAGTSGAIALMLAVLVCFGLIAPVELSFGGYRLSALILSAAAAAGAVASFTVVRWRWNANLADVAMGLMSLAVCALLTALVPAKPAALADRFPMVFNALVSGLAILTWFWVWVSGVWRQQLDDGQPWTTAGHLVKPANRFAFRTATIGLALAALMAVWPRLRAIGAMDDSTARMAFGIAGHLLLLLAVLWSGRKTGRPTFHVLGGLTLLSLLAFIAVRAAG